MIVSQGLSGWTAIPAAVWDVSVWCDDVEGVVDEVVLQDAVVGRAGGQRWRGIDLRITKSITFHVSGKWHLPSMQMKI